MKSLKSKILGIGTGLAIGLATIFPINGAYSQTQDTIQTETKKERDWSIGVGFCLAFPQDSELNEVFNPYRGLTAQFTKKVSNNFHIGINGFVGWKNDFHPSKEYTNYVRLNELSAMLIYKKGRFEIGAGPKTANLSLIERKKKPLQGTTGVRSEKYKGFGWEGKIKYKIIDTKILDLSLIGMYSKVKQNDATAWPQLGTSKIGLLLEF